MSLRDPKREADMSHLPRPRDPKREAGMSLPQLLDKYQIPYTDEDLRLRPMKLFVELSKQFWLFGARPLVYSELDMERHTNHAEWRGWQWALRNVLFFILEASKQCKDPEAVMALAEVKAYVEREIESIPDLT